ncbi:tight adherence protein B [Parelusimicrobium proximum]|uniref:type II secretion system F family protein n=1 Tax=Parelusimicrobium proximum TaxID=3228953 RepID=UPI003D1731F1
MKKYIVLGLTLFLAACGGGGKQAEAPSGPFSKGQQRVISCAREKALILYTYFDTKTPEAEKKYSLSQECGGNPAKAWKVPDWLEEDKRYMRQRSLGFDSKEGKTIMENEAWESAFADVLVALNTAQDSYSSTTLTTADAMRADYVSVRTFLSMHIDMLNKVIMYGKRGYTMKDSMQGRGRDILASFNLINEELESVLESFVNPNPEKSFVESNLAIAVLTHEMFHNFHSPAPIFGITEKDLKNVGKVNYFSMLLVVIGALVVFVGTAITISRQEEQIISGAQNYMSRGNAWADDFNRQFIDINVKALVLGTVGVFGVLGLMIGFLAGGFTGVIMFLVFIVIGGVMGIRMPAVVLKNMKQARGKKINEQLMDALILLSNSLKSGMDIVQGFEMVSKDLRPPIADEFALVIKNYKLGTSFEKALDGLEERVESRLLSYMIKAVVLQRQVGGNLTKIFERIVENIREESKLEDKLQAMTAQNKIQSIVVAVMPWLMTGMMFMFKPDTMISFYTTGIGLVTLVFCIGWISIGMKMVRKMGEVKV